MANCPRDDLYADILLTGAMNEHSGKLSGILLVELVRRSVGGILIPK